MLQVSLRTLQNWMAGVNPPPYMAIKLLRLLRYVELPGASWQGWSFSRGMLVTPEGRTIAGHESSWWSLLIRRAHGFTELYDRQKSAKLPVRAERVTVQTSGPGAAGTLPDAGLVSVSTSHTPQNDTWGQHGAIIGPWPTISDFPPLLMPMPGPDASASESALTPCFASPWMPTLGSQTVQSPQSPKHPKVSANPSQPAPQWHKVEQTSTPAGPGLRLTPSPARLQLLNPLSCPSLAKPNAGNSPPSSAKRVKTNANSGPVLDKVAA